MENRNLRLIEIGAICVGVGLSGFSVYQSRAAQSAVACVEAAVPQFVFELQAVEAARQRVISDNSEVLERIASLYSSIQLSSDKNSPELLKNTQEELSKIIIKGGLSIERFKQDMEPFLRPTEREQLNGISNYGSNGQSSADLPPDTKVSESIKRLTQALKSVAAFSEEISNRIRSEALDRTCT